MPPKGSRLTVEQRAKIGDANRVRWLDDDYRRRITASMKRVRKVASGGTLSERLDFYSMPEPNSGCHLWLGSVNPNGYGFISWKGRVHVAHRAAWMAKHGDIPDGLCVCHRCDNRCCINVDHLFLGTNAENTADKMRKGRHRVAPPLGEACAAAKLTAEQVLAIRSSSLPQKDIAREYGVHQSRISRIRAGKDWRHL